MSISNGQPGSATTFNTGFISRTVDDNTTGKKDLQNVAAASGAAVLNVQREINSHNAYSGRAGGTAHDATPTWTNNEVGTGTDTLRARADALTLKFNTTSGHDHDGVDSKQISANDLQNINKFACEYQSVEKVAASGTSVDVSAEFTGLVNGGANSTLGVLTSPPDNKVQLISKTTGTSIEDAGGQKVYGRITWAASVWTLSFYTNEAGVETAHSLASTDITIFYREVFSLATRPTIPADTGEIGSLDLTADVVDAGAAQRGAVSTGTQSFSGAKTFLGNIIADAALALNQQNNAQAGASLTLTTPTKSVVRLTGAATSIEGVTAPVIAQMFILMNVTGSDLTIVNDTGTAANRILTGTGAVLTMLANASIILVYDLTTAKWRVVGGSGSGPGVGLFSTQAFTGTTIVGTSDGLQKWRYTGGSAQTLASIDVTAVDDGTVLNILGTDDTNTITLNHLDSANGWLLRGTWDGFRGAVLSLQWDATLVRFVEVSRNA